MKSKKNQRTLRSWHFGLPQWRTLGCIKSIADYWPNLFKKMTFLFDYTSVVLFSNKKMADKIIYVVNKKCYEIEACQSKLFFEEWCNKLLQIKLVLYKSCKIIKATILCLPENDLTFKMGLFLIICILSCVRHNDVFIIP